MQLDEGQRVLIAGAVLRRRRSLRITQETAAAAYGPSVRTWQAIESATAKSMTPRTAAAVELSLLWLPGSVEQIVVHSGDASPADSDGWTSGNVPWAQFARARWAHLSEMRERADSPLSAYTDEQLIAELSARLEHRSRRPSSRAA